MSDTRHMQSMVLAKPGINESVSYRFEPVWECVMCAAREARVLGRRLNAHQGLRPSHRTGIATTVVQCRQCGLIYSNPRPVPESTAQHYDRTPEDYWVEEYFRESPRHFDDELRWFQQLWARRGKPRALDVGAGIGKTMKALERKGFDAYGLEPSPSFRQRALANGIPPDRLHLGPIESAEYERHTFDLVSFGAVLEHLHDPAAAIDRGMGWLAPGGLIHAEVPSARWLMARLLNFLYRVQGLDYVTNLSPMHPPYHLYEFTLDAFRKNGERAGYEVISQQWFACQTFLPWVLDPLARKVMTSTRTGMQLRVWLARVSSTS